MKSPKCLLLFVSLVTLQFFIIILYKYFYNGNQASFPPPQNLHFRKQIAIQTKSTQPISCEMKIHPKTKNLKTTIYGITPTSVRLTQKADLTRLLQTLLNVPNFHWIVVEDSDKKTSLVNKLLKQSGLSYTHLSTATKLTFFGGKKGIDQRNLALKWIRGCIPRNQSGVVYFMDDDNTYSLKVFEEMRTTKVASCWLVDFAGGLKFEGPGKCENGTVLSWYSSRNLNRKFPIDMAAFAINLERIFKFSNVLFSWKWRVGTLESSFLESLELTMNNMEAKANCEEVLVWHTKTADPSLTPWYFRLIGIPSYKNSIEV